MARGLPAVWSTLLSLPFLLGGIYFYLSPESIPETTIPPENLKLIGIPLAGFGLFILVIGLYVHSVAPAGPSLREDEELIDTRNPSQRVAISQISISVPFLGVASHLFFFTTFPYVYPTVALIIGLYFFSSGVKTYWVNTLITYYATTRRVISEYRLISVRRQELPLDKIRGIEERKSLFEALVGLGNIRIASGGGSGAVRLTIRNIPDSKDFANEVRDRM